MIMLCLLSGSLSPPPTLFLLLYVPSPCLSALPATCPPGPTVPDRRWGPVPGFPSTDPHVILLVDVFQKLYIKALVPVFRVPKIAQILWGDKRHNRDSLTHPIQVA